MNGPRVLLVLGTSEGWSIGILQGFGAAAMRSGWQVMHEPGKGQLGALAKGWKPAVAVVGPEISHAALQQLSCPLISVNADRSTDGIASVVPDEDRIAELALRHLIDRGFDAVTTFRLGEAAFGLERERAFAARARHAGARVLPGFSPRAASRSLPEEHEAVAVWLATLPRPCGVFACCDRWARAILHHARLAALDVPEALALVGANNDVVECELGSPPLSSVAVPWRALGEEAATLAHLALAGLHTGTERVVVSPVDVVPRLSSDCLAVHDELVGRAIAWIEAHTSERLRVPMVAQAVASSPGRLDRRFRSSLGRSVHAQIRRSRVEAAKSVLRTTTLELKLVARQTGFATPALLNESFRRELGMTPGAYRQHMRDLPGER